MVTQIGYSVAGGLGGLMILCAVCTVHVEPRIAGFLVEPQNQDRRFISRLASKSLGRFVSGLDLKPLGRFSPVDLKIGGDSFFWFGLNLVVKGFPIWASKSASTVY
jgi:hypothetical protein